MNTLIRYLELPLVDCKLTFLIIYLLEVTMDNISKRDQKSPIGVCLDILQRDASKNDK